MTNDLDRRAVLTATGLLSLATATGACAQQGEAPISSGSKILVAYFSRSGNTRVIAGTIKRALSADLFEIRAARPYPEDYEATVAQARQEIERGYEPPLEARVSNLGSYETLLLGFPSGGRRRRR